MWSIPLSIPFYTGVCETFSVSFSYFTYERTYVEVKDNTHAIKSTTLMEWFQQTRRMDGILWWWVSQWLWQQWSCLWNALKSAISAKSAFNLRSYPCFTVPSTYVPMLSVCSFFFPSVPSAIAFKLLGCFLSMLTPLIAGHTYTTYSL